jgi:hypothetical protein
MADSGRNSGTDSLESELLVDRHPEAPSPGHERRQKPCNHALNPPPDSRSWPCQKESVFHITRHSYAEIGHEAPHCAKRPCPDPHQESTGGRRGRSARQNPHCCPTRVPPRYLRLFLALPPCLCSTGRGIQTGSDSGGLNRRRLNRVANCSRARPSEVACIRAPRPVSYWTAI